MSDDDLSPEDVPGGPPEYDPSELERLLRLGAGNVAAHGPMFRELMAARVWFFVPPHPEMVSHMRDETAPLTWCSFQDAQGTFVPVFTSLRAAEQRAVMMKGNEPMMAEIPARVLLAHLNSAKCTVLVVASNGATIRLPPEALEELVSGRLTETIPGGGVREKMTLQPVRPDELPAVIVDAITEFCEQRQGAISVHVFHPKDEASCSVNRCELRIIVRLRDNAGHFYNDFCLMVEQTVPKGFTRAVGAVEPDDEAGMEFLARCTPVWPVV